MTYGKISVLGRRLQVLRSLSLLVALLTLSTRLLGVAHLGQVAHRACAEHGELMEVARASQDAAQPGDQGAAAALAQAPSSEGHDHDHCPVAGHQRQATACGANALAIIAHLAPQACLSPQNRSLFDSGPDRLRLAPKHSPPA